jgi:hypothetical protein
MKLLTRIILGAFIGFALLESCQGKKADANAADAYRQDAKPATETPPPAGCSECCRQEDIRNLLLSFAMVPDGKLGPQWF